MQTWIYKGNRRANTYLYITREDDFSQVPDALINLLGTMRLVVEVQLSPDRKLAQVDVNDVMQQLTAEGYYLQLPPGDHKIEKLC